MRRCLSTAVPLYLVCCFAGEQARSNPPTQPTESVIVQPVPVVSTSGRFSSPDPQTKPDRVLFCRKDTVPGRVISDTLVLVPQFQCGNIEELGAIGLRLTNAVMNVQFSDPTERSKMNVGAGVFINADFVVAFEHHGTYGVSFLIAKNAALTVGAPPEPSTGPARPITSYIVCRAPAMESLSVRLGKEICIQSSLLDQLSTLEPAVEAAAATPVDETPGDSGSAEPNGITCRTDPERTDLRLSTIACARNYYWAWWAKKYALNERLIQPAPP